MSIVRNLMLKSFVIFCKYVILKVSSRSRHAQVSVPSRLFAPSLSLGTSVSRLGLEDSSSDIYSIVLFPIIFLALNRKSQNGPSIERSLKRLYKEMSPLIRITTFTLAGLTLAGPEKFCVSVNKPSFFFLKK